MICDNVDSDDDGDGWSDEYDYSHTILLNGQILMKMELVITQISMMMGTEFWIFMISIQPEMLLYF